MYRLVIIVVLSSLCLLYGIAPRLSSRPHRDEFRTPHLLQEGASFSQDGFGLAMAGKHPAEAAEEYVERLALDVRRMTQGEMDQLAQKVARNEHDERLRSVLILGYAMRKPTVASESERRRLQYTHIVYLIRHRPTAPLLGSLFAGSIRRSDELLELYSEARSLWLGHLEDQPLNQIILWNATRFFIDDIDIFIKLCERAMTIDPESARWTEALGLAYWQMSLRRQERGVAEGFRQKAMDMYERWLKMERERSRVIFGLPALLRVGIDVGDWNRLERHATYAAEMVVDSGAHEQWPLLHVAYTSLGLCAAHRGEWELAETYLALSVPQDVDDHFIMPPCMDLARALARNKRTKEVLAYLERCQLAFPADANLHKMWGRELQEGRLPSFNWVIDVTTH